MALRIDDLPQNGPSSPFSSFFFFKSKECVELREFTIKKKRNTLRGNASENE